MVIVALLSFAVMLIAWILAPAEPAGADSEDSIERSELSLAEAA